MTTEKASEKSKNGSSTSNSKQSTVSDKDVRQESSKAANAAVSAQQKAKRLRDAATAASDPSEREKLTEQAVNAEIEAESFGKTAKYMRSGAFQGMAAGAGLGLAPSASLGALTGTLVGGVTSVITSGLGGGIGAAAGAVHGPMVDMGKLAGKGMRKATGFLPEWVASEEQKRTLEKMVGQIKEEEMPDEKELNTLREEGGNVEPDKGWMEGVRGMLPATGGAGEAGDGEKNAAGSIAEKATPEIKDHEQQESKEKQPKRIDQGSEEAETEQHLGETSKEQEDDSKDSNHKEQELNEKEERLRKKEQELNEKEKMLDQKETRLNQQSSPSREKPRKLNSPSAQVNTESDKSNGSKKAPRKLETRSKNS